MLTENVYLRAETCYVKAALHFCTVTLYNLYIKLYI